MKKKLFTIMSVLVFFTACDKTPDENSILSNNASSPKTLEDIIPVYSDIEELFNAIDTANSFVSLDQLTNYEKNKGKISIGSTSDLFYNSIDPESFVNEQDALDFYRNNKKYLDTLCDEYGNINIYPKYFNSPYRYVANNSGLFQVGQYVTKLFKNGIATSNISNIAALLKLNEDNCGNPNSNIIYIPYNIPETKTLHSGCLPSSQVFADTVNSGSDHRMILKTYSKRTPILVAEPPVGEPPVYDGYNCKMLVKIQNEKKVAGIWWLYENIFSCTGSITPHYDSIGNNTWIISERPINYAVKRNSAIITALNFNGGNNCNLHHYAFDIYLNSPGYPVAAHLQHIHP